MQKYEPLDYVILFGLAVLVLGCVYGVTALATGENKNEWTQIDDRCFVHTTKDNRVWLLGHNGPTVRAVYCLKGTP